MGKECMEVDYQKKKKKKQVRRCWGRKQDARKIAFLGRKRLNEMIPVSERRLDRGHGPFLIPRPGAVGRNG